MKTHDHYNQKYSEIGRWERERETGRKRQKERDRERGGGGRDGGGGEKERERERGRIYTHTYINFSEDETLQAWELLKTPKILKIFGGNCYPFLQFAEEAKATVLLDCVK